MAAGMAPSLVSLIIAPMLIVGGFLLSVGALELFASKPALALPFKKHGENDKEERDPVVVFETNKGSFKIIVYRKDAPVTSENFLSLIEKGFYDGTTFHRYEQDFCIQGGDPTGTGRGGSEKAIPLEICKKLRHNEAGTVGMARPEKNRDGATSQFYITLKPQNGLDGDYAVFGKVVEGMETIYQIRKGDTLTKVYIEGSKEGSKK